MNASDLSTVLVYGSIFAYTVAMIAFATDLFGLGSGRAAPARKAAKIGMNTTWLAASLHLGGLIARAIAAGRLTWANMYEFTLMSTFIVVAIFLALNFVRDMRYLGSLITLVTVLGLGTAVSVLFVKADGVQPVLDSYWLIIHVSVATLSTALFYLGAAFAVLQLMQHAAERKTVGTEPVGVTNLRTRERTKAAGRADEARRSGEATNAIDLLVEDEQTGPENPPSPFLRLMSSIPVAAKLEVWAYRIVGVGFVTWTFTVIAGAIWAEHAWGRPWGWDPKETWSFVVWIIYAAYLHARATAGWTAEKFAYFLLIGFVALLANFYLVNIFIPGKHSYAF